MLKMSRLFLIGVHTIIRKPLNKKYVLLKIGWKTEMQKCKSYFKLTINKAILNLIEKCWGSIYVKIFD